MQALFFKWELYAKGFSKMANKPILWKEHKLEKWLKVFCPCQLQWIPDTTKVVVLDHKKKNENVHGDSQSDKHLSLD